MTLTRHRSTLCAAVRDERGTRHMKREAKPEQPELRVIKGGLDEARCVECSIVVGPTGRWWSDPRGRLIPYCAGCSKREFGD